MTSVKLINHSSSTADWNYLFVSIIHFTDGIEIARSHFETGVLVELDERQTQRMHERRDG